MSRLLRARRPRWTADLASFGSPLGTVAEAVGVDSAIGFPLVVDDEVVAVVEFFWSSRAGATEPDDQLIATLWDGVNQLGRVVERVRARDELSHQALHDSLTGLPNRALLLDRLAHALERQRREPSFLAVIFIDVDNFKLINDSLGHDAGDRLLVTIARRLRRMIRPDDTAARFGGDEFIILCDRLPSEEVAVDVTERILAGLAAPVSLDRNNEAVVRASAGIAIARGPDASPEALLRDADSAMYRAKEAGRGRYQVFDAAMHQRATERLAIANELRTAIADGELRLVYQPQIDLESRRIVGVEALVRWAHPTRGMLGPLEFIGVAEETQLVVPLGSWVIWEACRQAASWAQGCTNHPDLQRCENV
jgi:diguanylate cyclase (GGDEF)-like protein